MLQTPKEVYSTHYWFSLASLPVCLDAALSEYPDFHLGCFFRLVHCIMCLQGGGWEHKLLLLASMLCMANRQNSLGHCHCR